MPILDEHMIEFFSKSPEQTRRLGMRMGAILHAGDLVCLQGDLGAGKTTMVQGIAKGWGTVDEVASPTFVLVNTYRRADESLLFHFDAFRIESASEAEELDIDLLLAQGALVVEWPERVETILPGERLWAFLEYHSDEHRAIRLTAHGRRADSLLDSMRHSIYGAD